MLNSDYYPYPHLLGQLSTSLHQGQSGTFLIATEANTSCRFAITDGELTHCTFSRLHGEEALIAFTRIQTGRCSFNSMTYPFRPAAAVAHERALEILNIRQTTAPSTHPVKPRLVSGSMFTQEEIEQLFGKFYFE